MFAESAVRRCSVARFYPTVPSICSSISRFISTAYSIGSSLTSGSMKPLTIIVLASASDRPRLVQVEQLLFADPRDAGLVADR